MLMDKTNIIQDDEDDWDYYEPNTNFRVWAIVILLMVIMIILGLAYVKYREIKVNEILITQYKKETEDIKKDVNLKIDQLNEQYATKILYKIYSPADINELSTSLWEYALYLNDAKIVDTALMNFKDGDILTLNEIRIPSTLPKEIIEKGSVTQGDPNDHISFHLSLKGVKSKMIQTADGMVTKYLFSISNPQMNNSFELILSKQLAQRLNFQKERYQIEIGNASEDNAANANSNSN